MRTALAAVGAVALLLAGPGAAYADDPVGTTDCGQTAPGSAGSVQPETVCQAGGVSPGGDSDGGASGCAENPVICESGTPVGSGDQQCTAEPVSDTATAGIDPTYPCYIAYAGAPQGSPNGGAAAPEAAPAQLPRTGPAPLLESVAVGSWLLLLGVLALIAGRRTARA